MKNKQGISLIILVVTIILILILVGTLTVSSGDSVGNSRIATFASDLQEVEDATKTYYMLNGKFPSIDEKAYTQGEISAVVPSRYKGKFIEELQLNNDYVSNDSKGTYYMIDLAKIDIQQSTRGIRLDDEGNLYESDVYVVAYPSMNVYYLDGLRANDEVYFSLSSKITKLTTIVKEETIEEGETSLTISNGIIVKKENDDWSNELNIVIETNMDDNELLYMQIGEGTKHLITTVSGKNVLELRNNFASLYSNTTNQEINTGVGAEEIDNFNSLTQENKKLVITKELDGDVIGKVIVNLENYENDLPVISGDISIGYEPTYNYIYFNVSDITSGIENVKYEYLTKIDENGNSVQYFENVESYDDDYMKSRAKSASISSSGLVEIKLPKDIESVQINVFDEAGNISTKINKTVIYDTYLGISETEVTTTSLKINTIAKIPDEKVINNWDITLSTDGINYANRQDIAFGSLENGIYSSGVNYYDLENVSDKIYVKVTLNYGENEEIIRIKEIDIDTIKV